MILPDSLTARLNALSAPAAYDLLVVLGHANVFIYLQGKLVIVKDWVKDDEVVWLPANNTPIALFWGGPPTRLTYYEGNLHTLLLDRIYDYLRSHTLNEFYQVMGPPTQFRYLQELPPIQIQKQGTFQWS